MNGIKLRALCIIFVIILCAGCQDKIELEDRAFAGTIAFDKGEGDSFLAGAELLIFKENINDNKERDDGERDILITEGAQPVQTLLEMNSHSSKVLSYALTKSCLLGEELLKDKKKLKQVVDSLLETGWISGEIIVIAVRGSAVDLLKKEVRDEVSLNTYLIKYLGKNDIIKTDLMHMSLALSKNGDTGLALFNIGETGPDFAGTALISNGTWKNQLQEKIR